MMRWLCILALGGHTISGKRHFAFGNVEVTAATELEAVRAAERILSSMPGAITWRLTPDLHTGSLFHVEAGDKRLAALLRLPTPVRQIEVQLIPEVMAAS